MTEMDVIIVGAGPAGLSAAIRLKQLNPQCQVCILEKGAEVGSHILSGAVLDVRALNTLLPDWKEKNAPIHTKVSQDQFLFLSERHAFSLPIPKVMRNDKNYIISLSDLCRFLAREAKDLGVEIYPGFSAVKPLFNSNDEICGVVVGEKGVNKKGEKTERYQLEMELRAKQVLLSEGCRGSLSKQVIHHYQLNKESDPDTFALGVKELWQISPKHHKPGTVFHSVGWPLDFKTYGGSFAYHWGQNLVSVGFVTGLDYQNPTLDPFQLLQQFKCHPKMKPLFEGGKRLGYGARVLCEGGYQSLPKLCFPGGLLIGDSAGFLNVPRIKGIHMAMQSGIIAAETLCDGKPELYEQKIKASWVFEELYAARNVRPGFRFGLVPGLLFAAFEMMVSQGKLPYTLHHKGDVNCLKKSKDVKTLCYPKPDNILTFDKLSSLSLSNITHEENQPTHLKINDEAKLSLNIQEYGCPEKYYCPANVYELLMKNDKPTLQINAQNCLHCKACDIKEPLRNITWTPPEGGSGPNYSGM